MTEFKSKVVLLEIKSCDINFSNNVFTNLLHYTNENLDVDEIIFQIVTENWRKAV